MNEKLEELAEEIPEQETIEEEATVSEKTEPADTSVEEEKRTYTNLEDTAALEKLRQQ